MKSILQSDWILTYQLCLYLVINGNLMDELGREPTDQEVLNKLDEGHASWFKLRARIRSNSNWDSSRRLKERSKWHKKMEILVFRELSRVL